MTTKDTTPTCPVVSACPKCVRLTTGLADIAQSAVRVGASPRVSQDAAEAAIRMLSTAVGDWHAHLLVEHHQLPRLPVSAFG
ncbi:hypothetical protein BIV57_10885 [Mangrovactinospora gilvigrisea]|uniref:Uncharacterized protein n=1 Tax=Mangrovactinospora gilvigrisea TaxID=1428644 RepID=A0A1J7CCR7_9ACTN|nr:hypothetical protein [Mangrovactinospora gilvigrisea]OIV37466.1 hypothetical protein BIV57_10885 [Mangrovactinospora gilvigrisea]